ncbi:MAG TPA: substrate-binding domain-containing protein [Syntrophorhabdaceae bacterium]|nr:substrate-binding domain-containing protein [Syntrophorhabdaceae bacterium]
MKKWFVFTVLCLAVGLPQFCGAQENKFILMASTIGPIDSGIVDVLESRFEAESGIRVRHVGAGTGAALDIARKGNIDLVLVHAKSLEEKFMKEGYGTERIDFMYNDFVILGPSNDPAGIRGVKRADEALRRIAEKRVLFISRGDQSGTHVAEMSLWEEAGIKPAGPWYRIYERGAEGNAPTLLEADKQGAYTVMDRATLLTLQKQIKLVVLVEKDEALLNYISLIPVNPKKIPGANYLAAMAFITWLTDAAKGQAIVRDFGKAEFGSPLFFPNSKQWRDREGRGR